MDIYLCYCQKNQYFDSNQIYCQMLTLNLENVINVKIMTQNTFICQNIVKYDKKPILMSNQIPYDRNNPYNQLPLLPPPDDKVITIEILQALNKANKALAELKGLAKKLPNQSMLVNTIALREAKASTEIENIFITDEELYRELSGNDTGLKGNAKEVLRYRQALWQGFQDIKNNKEISIDVMVRIYQEIKELQDGIRPDITDTTIRRSGSGILGGTVVYTPPRGENVIKEKLENLISYINDDQNYPYDPLIKLAVTHYQFEAIHPFRDGNGRTGRILSILLMIQKELLDVPILYLSAYIIENKDDYYALLNNVTALRNWKGWILYMLKAVEETSVFTIKKISDIDGLFQKTYELVRLKLPHIHKETIEKIFEQPYISPKTLIGIEIRSINTAKKYLVQMEKLGIMIPKKIGKEIIYINLDLFNLLSET
jgi:Fic family protein